jgi:hypothetical protein
MTTQVTELSNQYADAADLRYRRQMRASPHQALRAVRARYVRQVRLYKAKPREAVERIIDACPQPPD